MRELLITAAVLATACGEPPPAQGSGGSGGAGGASGAGGAGVTCPPPGPFGPEVGDLVEGLGFTHCDGTSASLHDLCGAAVGVITTLYGWCAPCWSKAELMTDLQAEHGPQGMRSMLVVVEDSFEAPATADYCADIQEYLGAEVVVMDPERKMEMYGQPGLVLITDPEGRITFKRDDASHLTIQTAVEAVLNGE